MIVTEQHSILTVCLPDAGSCDLPMWRADSAQEALSILRLSHVDLLLTGLALPDMSPWQFLRRVRASADAPRWALIAAELSPADEIVARSLGAVAVLEQVPDTYDLLALLARVRRTSAAQSNRTHVLRRGSGARVTRTAGVGTDSKR
jgi:DNA-binding response OmpR family regulator